MRMKRLFLLVATVLLTLPLKADEGMWILPLLKEQKFDEMKSLGLKLQDYDIYSPDKASLKDAVVIFGGGCTGEIVSPDGLLLTNHHCGYGAIQSHSTVDHDYLTDGFWATTRDQELPNPGLTVTFIDKIDDVTDYVKAELAKDKDPNSMNYLSPSFLNKLAEKKVGKKFLQNNPGTEVEIKPFFGGNQYYMFTKKIYSDVRLVGTPPSSIGKFGADTDNWMWPRHTGDFSIFRVYANANNEPAEYSKDNKPYSPKYVAEVSLQGYQDKDFAMTIGFPGSTSRYLCSWGVQQRIEDENIPRIEVRGIKQEIWKKAMSESDAVRIKYASKYAGSSNYWKNSIGMNKGLARLGVIARKQEQEQAFAAWVAQDPQRQAKYGEVLNLLKEGYTSANECQRALVYLLESLERGTEIVSLARMVNSFDAEGSTDEERQIFLEDRIKPFFKDYEPALDQQVLAAMMQIAKERIPAAYLPDEFANIDKKYKGDYKKYAADVFKKTKLLSYDNIVNFISDPKKNAKLKKDPAFALSLSSFVALIELKNHLNESADKITKGERLYLAGLMEMYPDKTFYSDANFTMRASYGSIGGYRPYDAAWYNYFTTEKGILEKQDPTNDEFWVQEEILDLVRSRDFGQYANENGDLQLCFLTNNDITGGNSGSPIFDKNARLIGLAFDGNWEAMSGDIAFEPELQRCIGVDIRYVLFMIDKWGKCPRLIQELKLVK